MRYNVLTYLIGEGIRNFLKNKKSTIAALAIMICTMFMFGLFFVIGENINHLMDQVQEEQAIQAFFESDATNEEMEEVRRQIANMDGVAEATIVTKQEALDSMKSKLEKHPDLIEDYEKNNIFPASVLVRLDDLTKSAEIQQKILDIRIGGEQVIGNDDITSSDNTINALIKIANFIRLVTGIILVLLIAISTFIISNTIKLTVHARRKEISIMKYVGATNGFIRWPFIVEGMIIGLISSLISIAIVGGVYNLIAEQIVNANFMQIMNVHLVTLQDMLVSMIVVYLILGIGIGVLGSVISMRKYLKV